MVTHTVREELRGILIFVGMIWCVYLVGLVVPFSINSLGVTPRTLRGLVGIPLMPFLHGGFGHLLSNTIPLLVLLALLAGSKANSWAIVSSIVVLSGVLLWMFGRPMTVHIGASGLVYGLIGFLLVSGPLERRLVPLAVSLLVGFVYGWTLLSGVIPDFGSQTSWEGHLCGAIAGGLVAGILTKGRVNSAD